ncbi:B3 domain-containing protein At4g34400-like [Cornus florida]|uniref:B3 domain-containing protein At4g34400-like n=1 Tax=Cornus florida TaxID=4283 RepID=UPI002898E0FD|nr:B3 domain-containing protein At4g34400-like [Cornus florida]
MEPTKSCHEFFKVFLPANSSQRLLIPLGFTANLKEMIPNKVLLRNCDGKFWPVEVKKIGNDHLFFEDGWVKFVEDNSIELGDFLVFHYNAGDNGDAAVKVGDEHRGAAVVEGEDDYIFETGHYVRPKNPYFVAKMKQTTRKNDLLVPADVIEDHNLKLPSEIVIRDQDSKTWISKVVVWRDGRTWIRGWKALMPLDFTANLKELIPNQNLDEEEEEIYEEEERIISGGTSPGHNGNAAVKVGDEQRGTAVVEGEDDYIFETGHYVQPKNPCFVAKMKRTTRKNDLRPPIEHNADRHATIFIIVLPALTNVFSLYYTDQWHEFLVSLYAYQSIPSLLLQLVPADVIKDNNLKLPSEIVLRDQDSKTWTSKVVVWSDGRTWIRGWKAAEELPEADAEPTFVVAAASMLALESKCKLLATN